MRVAVLTAGILFALIAPALAQPRQAPAPAVGVVRAERQQITQTDEFIGRIQSIGRVAIVARVTAFLEKRLFTEGSEVKQGDLLYELERGPFEADLANKQAQVAQAQALLRNASITLSRAESLLHTPAGQQSTVDDALAQVANYAAQVQAGEAQVRASQINLDYTEIRAPIDGKISSTQVTEGNVVSPTSGTLAMLVSQDPMYVVFPVSVRAALDLRDRYATRGGFGAVAIKLRLPDGTIYSESGKLDYIAPSIEANTDTITLRGTIKNATFPGMQAGSPGSRQLADGEFVTVLLEGVEPVYVLGIPRAAVLSDQQGDYVYVVDAQNKAEVRRIQLGQSTPSTAVVTSGLKEGELVIAEGLQRVRPGAAVMPGPATPAPMADGAASRPEPAQASEAAKPAPGAPAAKP